MTKRIKKPPFKTGLRSHEAHAGAPATIAHPVFCLRHLQNGYDIENCADEDKLNLLRKLRTLSQMTWQDIYNAHRHGLGREKIARTSIKRPIPGAPLVTDDVDFIAFRFSGMRAMIGFRSENIFRILWLDHDFSVYPH